MGTDIDVLADALGRPVFPIGEADGSGRVVEAFRRLGMGQGGMCSLPFPTPPTGHVIDPSGVRLFVRNLEVPELSGEADCALSPSGGWYRVHNAEEPEIAVCPCTCASTGCGAYLELMASCMP
jgi:hypothetical protein